MDRRLSFHRRLPDRRLTGTTLKAKLKTRTKWAPHLKNSHLDHLRPHHTAGQVARGHVQPSARAVRVALPLEGQVTGPRRIPMPSPWPFELPPPLTRSSRFWPQMAPPSPCFGTATSTARRAPTTAMCTSVTLTNGRYEHWHFGSTFACCCCWNCCWTNELRWNVRSWGLWWTKTEAVDSWTPRCWICMECD